MRIYKVIVVISVVWVVYFVTGIFWSAPKMVVGKVRSAVEEMVPRSEGSSGKTSDDAGPMLILGICTFDQLREMIQAVSPLLLPIIAYRYRHKMDLEVARQVSKRMPAKKKKK